MTDTHHTPEAHKRLALTLIWVTPARRGNIVEFKQIAPVDVPAGRTLHLWRIDKDGNTASLGPIPAGKWARITLSEPAEKVFFPAVELAVSIEPLAAIRRRPARRMYIGGCAGSCGGRGVASCAGMEEPMRHGYVATRMSAATVYDRRLPLDFAAPRTHALSAAHRVGVRGSNARTPDGVIEFGRLCATLLEDQVGVELSAAASRGSSRPWAAAEDSRRAECHVGLTPRLSNA